MVETENYVAQRSWWPSISLHQRFNPYIVIKIIIFVIVIFLWWLWDTAKPLLDYLHTCSVKTSKAMGHSHRGISRHAVKPVKSKDVQWFRTTNHYIGGHSSHGLSSCEHIVTYRYTYTTYNKYDKTSSRKDKKPYGSLSQVMTSGACVTGFPGPRWTGARVPPRPTTKDWFKASPDVKQVGTVQDSRTCLFAF